MPSKKAVFQRTIFQSLLMLVIGSLAIFHEIISGFSYQAKWSGLPKHYCSGHLTHFMEFIPSLLCTLTCTKQLLTTHLPILGPNKPHRLRPYLFGEEKKWKISIMSTLGDSCFESLMQQYKSNMKLVSTFVSKESLSWSLHFHLFHRIVDIEKTPGHCCPKLPWESPTPLSHSTPADEQRIFVPRGFGVMYRAPNHTVSLLLLV